MLWRKKCFQKCSGLDFQLDKSRKLQPQWSLKAHYKLNRWGLQAAPTFLGPADYLTYSVSGDDDDVEEWWKANWGDIYSLWHEHSKEISECFWTIFLQFLLIFHRAAAGELQEESGLMALARLSEINVSTEGVMGAKDFFEAKVLWQFLLWVFLCCLWHLP